MKFDVTSCDIEQFQELKYNNKGSILLTRKAVNTLVHYFSDEKSVALSVGKLAGKICREKGILIGKVSDEKWGNVNSYPITILREAFINKGIIKEEGQLTLNL